MKLPCGIVAGHRNQLLKQGLGFSFSSWRVDEVLARQLFEVNHYGSFLFKVNSITCKLNIHPSSFHSSVVILWFLIFSTHRNFTANSGEILIKQVWGNFIRIISTIIIKVD